MKEEKKILSVDELTNVSGGTGKCNVPDPNDWEVAEVIKQLASEDLINGYDPNQFKPKER